MDFKWEMSDSSSSNARDTGATGEQLQYQNPVRDLAQPSPLPTYNEATQFPSSGYMLPGSSRINSGVLPPSQLSEQMFSSPFTTALLAQPCFDKPIAIPALRSGRDSPFLRAYPPSLEAVSISPTAFLDFVDHLNRVTVRYPPLLVLGVVGDVVGFVPEPTAMIVGTAVSAAAQISAGVVSYGRTEMELRKANAEIFGPAGLKVEIARLDAVAKLTRMPILDKKGKVNKKAAVLKPLVELDDGGLPVSGQQRRLDAMKEWIAPLQLSPSEEVEPHTPFRRFHQMISEKKKEWEEKKLVQKRCEVQHEYLKETRKLREQFDEEMHDLNKDLEKDLRKLDAEMESAMTKPKPEKIEKLERKRARVLAQYDKDRRKEEKEFNKEMKEAEEDRLSDDEEEQNMRRILWLIIRDKNAPSGSGPNPDLPSAPEIKW